ncbi:hypothetical protein BOX15_Mlig014170g1 [Macrostomum lignano]|uniref:RNA-directed DNA polymerase n=2 Tax=Macrostomum lignano TaxID=282301 RepID=A0A267GET3_9PLAT|nr:hypothetical protein BOX15_Mlig014170g1 [Macrostomum lignano]
MLQLCSARSFRCSVSRQASRSSCAVYVQPLLRQRTPGRGLPDPGFGKLLRTGERGPSPALPSKAQTVSIFLPGSIAGRPCRWLFDTGAQVTLVSAALLRVLGVDAQLHPPISTPVGIDGRRLESPASATIAIQLEGLPSVEHQVMVVAGIQPECVLGMDAIGKMCSSFSVNLPASSVQLGSTRISILPDRSSSQACRVVPTAVIARVASTVSIPARSRVIIPVKVPSSVEQGLFEPSSDFIDKTGLLPNRALVVSSVDGNLPVGVCNVSADPVVLYQNQAIGNFDAAEVNGADGEPGEEEAGFNINPELSESQRERIESLLCQAEQAFARHEFDLGTTHLLQHEINLEPGSRPIKHRQRTVPLNYRQQVDEKISEMRRHGIIEPSCSPWASNLLVVRKKNNEIRICTDWRALNSCTVKDAYPLPPLSAALDALTGSSWFSTLDLRQGFLQVELREQDREKTAFYTTQGLMQYRKLGFGLCNAPATFQRLMDLTMAGLNWTEVLTYMDDLILFSQTFEKHAETLEQVLGRLQSAGLKLNKRKSYFCFQEVEYLGHKISAEGIRPTQDKVSAIQSIPIPECAEDVRRLVGMLGFYRRFVPHFASIANPLHQATQKSRQFQWTTQCDDALRKLKSALSTPPVLKLPDFSKGFRLCCDSSGVAIAGVLSQLHEDAECPVAYASRVLNKAERNYSTTHRELLAVVWAMKHFRNYLASAGEILVFTDHKPLQGLLNTKEPEGRLARWITFLQEINFKLLFRPGRENVVADALSRAAATRLHPAWSDNDIRVAQADDPVLAAARQVLLGQRPRRGKAADDAEHLVRTEKLDLGEDGVLKKSGQPVIPRQLRQDLLQLLHDDPASGHLGTERTLARVVSRAWWPGLKDDVQHWVSSCEVCQRRKVPHQHQRAPLQNNTVPSAPWEMVQVDIKGPLPETEAGLRYIICFTDVFSKWVEATAVSNIEARTVADALLRSVVLRHGAPEVIHSDQGRQFESDIFQELCRLLDIRKTRTTPFHPSGNPAVERFNRTLGDMLAAYCMEQQNKWADFLPYVIWAYNSSAHCTTKRSPYAVLHGCDPRIPAELSLPAGGERRLVTDTLADARTGLQLVRQRLQSTQRSRKQQYDKRQHFTPIQVGQLVMLSNPAVLKGQSKALRRRWLGPYRVLERLGPVTYRISKPAGRRRSTVVHHDRLKLFVRRRPQPASWQSAPTPPAAEAGRPPSPAVDPRLTWTDLLDEPTAVGPRRSARTRRPPDFYAAQN